MASVRDTVVLHAGRAARLAACVAALGGCAGTPHHQPRLALSRSGGARPRAARSGLVRRRFVLGRSAGGRPIDAMEVGNPRARRKLLVVGCIHGDEPAGIAVARALEGEPARNVDVWTIADLNPDGVAAHTRQNGRRVDLNRNFPWRWRRLGRPGDQQYSGPRPLSEPESRLAEALILRVRPTVAVWFHQPLGVVDLSGGDLAVERRFSRLSGLPLRRLPRYPGSAASWQDHALPGTSAFVIELRKGALTAREAHRYARALIELAGSRKR